MSYQRVKYLGVPKQPWTFFPPISSYSMLLDGIIIKGYSCKILCTSRSLGWEQNPRAPLTDRFDKKKPEDSTADSRNELWKTTFGLWTRRAVYIVLAGTCRTRSLVETEPATFKLSNELPTRRILNSFEENSFSEIWKISHVLQDNKNFSEDFSEDSKIRPWRTTLGMWSRRFPAERAPDWLKARGSASSRRSSPVRNAADAGRPCSRSQQPKGAAKSPPRLAPSWWDSL